MVIIQPRSQLWSRNSLVTLIITITTMPIIIIVITSIVIMTWQYYGNRKIPIMIIQFYHFLKSIILLSSPICVIVLKHLKNTMILQFNKRLKIQLQRLYEVVTTRKNKARPRTRLPSRRSCCPSQYLQVATSLLGGYTHWMRITGNKKRYTCVMCLVYQT